MLTRDLGREGRESATNVPQLSLNLGMGKEAEDKAFQLNMPIVLHIPLCRENTPTLLHVTTSVKKGVGVFSRMTKFSLKQAQPQSHRPNDTRTVKAKSYQLLHYSFQNETTRSTSLCDLSEVRVFKRTQESHGDSVLE